MSESDFVSTVSARLIAARLPRSQRLGALRLLGALDTLADRDDRVRRPLRQVGTEFDLPPGEVDAWFDALESVGAVAVDEGGIVLMGREEPVGSMRLHDFLAVVAELDERPARRALPALITPAAAVLVAAAVIAAIVLSPGVVLNGPSTARSSLAAPAGGTVTTAGATKATNTTAAPTNDLASPTEPPAVADRSAACPADLPAVEVLDVVNGATTTVTGDIANAAPSPVSVTAFSVIADVGGHDLPAVAGTTDPIDVPAGGNVSWSATLPATPAAGTTVRVVLEHWEWRGDATGCRG